MDRPVISIFCFRSKLFLPPLCRLRPSKCRQPRIRKHGPCFGKAFYGQAPGKMTMERLVTFPRCPAAKYQLKVGGPSIPASDTAGGPVRNDRPALVYANPGLKPSFPPGFSRIAQFGARPGSGAFVSCSGPLFCVGHIRFLSHLCRAIRVHSKRS